MTDTTIFEILNGPSELDLIFALSRGQKVSFTVSPTQRTDMPQPGVPTLRVNKGFKPLKTISIPVDATINGLEVESGDRKTWIVKGQVKPFGGNKGGQFAGFFAYNTGRSGFVEMVKA